MVVNRYLKLNTAWASKKWIAQLSDGGKLGWMAIQCHAKAHGIGGVVDAVDPWSLAQQNFIQGGEAAVLEAIEKAQEHNALRCDDGVWVLLNWGEEQGDETGAKRQKEWRDRQKASDEPKKPSRRNGRNALRNASNAEEKREENSEELRSSPPSSPKGDGGLCEHLPQHLRTPEVCDAYRTYETYRAERKLSKLVPTSIKGMAKNIVLAGCDAADIVYGLDGLVGSTWQGPPTGYWEKVAARHQSAARAKSTAAPAMRDHAADLLADAVRQSAPTTKEIVNA